MVCLIILVFLITYLWQIEMSSYVLCDSVPSHMPGPLVQHSDERNPSNNIYEHSVSVLTSSDKIKRWLGWKLIGHNKYVTKEEFYINWDRSFSIRSSFKNEIRDFKNYPLKYLGEYYNNSHNLYLKREELTKEFLRKTHYVEGEGWYTGAQIRQLSRRGYIIRDSKIIRK